MKTYARVIAVASALLMPFSVVATPAFFNQNIGSLDCGINEIAKFNGAEWVCAVGGGVHRFDALLMKLAQMK